MGHDLGLGGPCEVDRDPEALHPGPCFDGVYGCHRCWDASNDGKGTISKCEGRCGKENVPTRIIQALDEPELYASCADCRRRRDEEARQELEESRIKDGYYDCDDDGNDDETDVWSLP